MRIDWDEHVASGVQKLIVSVTHDPFSGSIYIHTRQTLTNFHEYFMSIIMWPLVRIVIDLIW